jgi:FkbM family methyltransferase
MKKVYLDFGGNKGQGLRSFISSYNIDPKDWIVETFEPDPNCNIENHIEDLSYVKINNKAVWLYDGKVDFSQMLNNSEGSSVECLMSEDNCANPNSESFRKNDSIISVDCLDISKILQKYKDHDFVLVKMDVEGSEFKILRKILEDDTIKIINHLYVEWHHKYVKGEDDKTVNDLKSKIIEKGIKIYEWH